MIDLETLELKCGAHASPKAGMCVMEAVAYFAGEKHSDHPECVCPTLGTFLRSWNDSVDGATRQKLKKCIPLVVGTAKDGNELRRSWMAFDWLTRECTASFLEAAKLTEQAATLRALPEIQDKASLDAAMPAIKAAQSAAAAAGAAAWDAAWAAAGDAAGAAAWDAAWAAAGDAAGAAAGDAAGAAARAAAWAGPVLQPVVARLQDSAFTLIDRMVALPRIQVHE